ncbi:MAG: hypothetical protein M3Y72_19300 [Acidobacteriota bacterium]|nr:hypothetical protein [Acidobacteriota bacterium]
MSSQENKNSSGSGKDGLGVAEMAAKSLITTASATTDNEALGFVVSPGGDAVLVPEGASGPNPVVNRHGKTTGFSYTAARRQRLGPKGD